MHLVLKNNRAFFHLPKIKSRLKSTFLCQFHKENTPSMIIDSLAQYGVCYGCGCSFDIFTYLSHLESLSKEEAIDFLCRIYYIEKENNMISDTDPRIKEYQEVFLSPEYRKYFLAMLEKKDEIKNNSYKRRCYKKINKDLKTIERIEKKEVLHFYPIPASKRLTLEWKEN